MNLKRSKLTLSMGEFIIKGSSGLDFPTPHHNKRIGYHVTVDSAGADAPNENKNGGLQHPEPCGLSKETIVSLRSS